MNRDEFVKSEYDTWGESYVDDLLDRGYEPVELMVDMGNGPKLRWWWTLTQPPACARVAPVAVGVSSRFSG
jgi:hypothetical protein